MEDGIGRGGDQQLGLLLRELGGAVTAAELYGFQLRQQGKLPGHLVQVALLHGGQVQRRYGAVLLPVQKVHGIVEVYIGEGLLHGGKLLQGQVQLVDGHIRHLVQVQQGFLQGVQVVVPGLQVQLCHRRVYKGAAQSHLVENLYLGERALQLLQRFIVVAARPIDGFQLGK